MKLAQTAVTTHLKALQKDGLVIKEKVGIYASFRANRESQDFKLLKIQNLIWRIHKSGPISSLDEKLKPNCIVLFGSASRDEDTETSDIDIFIQAEEIEFNLVKYENFMKRKIKLLFDTKLQNLSKELTNNIVSGQVLYGYLKVF